MISQLLIVFAIVLLITKSKIFACKREYVISRYEQSKVTGNPGIIHKIWHAIWTCPMCCGFWVSLLVACGNIFNALIFFGVNWLLHCLEDVLFYSGKYFKNLVENSDPKDV